MVSSLYFMSEHPERVLGRTIFTMTKNIEDPSSCPSKVYAVLKDLNLRLALVVTDLLIHIPIILDLRRCWVIIDRFAGASGADP